MAQDEQEAVTRVADRFFPVSETDGLRHNSRADEEITKALERIRKNQQNGKKGGRPKKPNQNPPVNPNETQGLTQTETQTVNQKKAHHTQHANNEQEQKPRKATTNPNEK